MLNNNGQNEQYRLHAHKRNMHYVPCSSVAMYCTHIYTLHTPVIFIVALSLSLIAHSLFVLAIYLRASAINYSL